MPQVKFLLSDKPETFYGGAAGGGKSDALLMAGLMYAQVPGYAAILFRRTYQDLSLPGALMDRAQEWLVPTDARWDAQGKTWHFPSGATLTFGYMDAENDRFRYQSAEFQMVGFDELTQFKERDYRFLFTRIRRLEGFPVPTRMRAASNPGGVGHDWVKMRFIDTPHPERAYVPARLSDNPYLDQEDYKRSLMFLDPVTREQYLNGDWTIREGGLMFKREWFEVVDAVPAEARWVRYWDLAATDEKKADDPDWTAGVRVGEKDGIMYVSDVKRTRSTPQHVEQLVAQTAALDGLATKIRMEQEPGSAGVGVVDHYTRRVLMGYDFKGIRPTGPKEVRAAPWSSYAEAGNIKLVRGPWCADFLDEVQAFPLGSHDDQVDALTGACETLGRPVYRSYAL